jgi:hypothetical protein
MVETRCSTFISVLGIRSGSDYLQPAELRSAWTGEGARPHTSTAEFLLLLLILFLD